MDEHSKDMNPDALRKDAAMESGEEEQPRGRTNYLPGKTRNRLSTAQNPRVTRFMPGGTLGIQELPESAMTAIPEEETGEAENTEIAVSPEEVQTVAEEVQTVAEGVQVIAEGEREQTAAPVVPENGEEKREKPLPGLPRQQVREHREFSVILRNQGRALSEALMTIAGTRQRSGRLWLTAFVTLVVISLLIVQVYYRHREINLGYELSAAISKREALLEKNRMLRIELRVQSRWENLEPLAGKQLGMTVIQPEQVLIVHTDRDLRKPSGTQRRDGLDKVKRIGE